MTVGDFIKNNLGKKVDYDKMYGPQCVDIFRQGCQDINEIPHTGGVVGAKDLWLNYLKLPKEVEYFRRVKPSSKPKKGDYAIWDATSSNPYGHVALVLAPLDEYLIVMEQDGFKQDGAKLGIKTKTNLLGYLRPRKKL